MRTLNFQEMTEVNGGFTAANFSYFMDKTMGYGATGVLANMVLNGVTVAVGVHGFLIGAGVGAAYAGVTIVAHSLNLY